MAMRKSSFLGVMGGRLELVEMSNTEPPSGRVLAPLKRRRQGRKSDRPYTHHQMVGALFHEVSPASGRGRQTTKNDPASLRTSWSATQKNRSGDLFYWGHRSGDLCHAAQHGPSGRAISASDLEGQTYQIVISRLDPGEVQSFDDPDPRAE